MRQPTVAIVGFGAVGQGLKQLFPDAVTYDPPKGIGARQHVNACRFALVAVPTPLLPDGTIDTSAVEEAVDWIECPYIVIRSTIPVGTTDRLRDRTGKAVVFQPEYGPADTPEHPFGDLRRIRWVILGGERAHTIPVADLYKTVFSSDIVIHQTDARTAELAKYMENCFLAVKVTFCNEFFDLAQVYGIDYNELRELWLLDPRIGRSHTFVFPEARGFGGRCLPKDIQGLVEAARALGYEPSLLAAAIAANDTMRQRAARAAESDAMADAAASENGVPATASLAPKP